MVRWSEAGLTLVEVMVALAIIGVMSGVAVLGLNGASRGASMEAEARRLASRLRLAADETMVTSRSLALDWDAGGYAFVAWDEREQRWKASEVEALGPRHQLPTGMQLQSERGAAPAVIAPEGAGTGIALDLTAPTGSWRVAFDGLNVEASPARIP